MTLLHLTLGTPQMTEWLARLGRDNFGALRDLTILWLLLTVSLIALARLAWIALEQSRFPDLADVLKAVGLGTTLVLGIAMLAWLIALSFIVGPRVGLAGYEIPFVDAVVLIACFIAATRVISRYGSGHRDEVEDRERS